MTNVDGFYGYKHWTLENISRCFYVGIGNKTRPYSKGKSRSRKWRFITKTLGLKVEICIGPVSKEEICEWEKENILIEKTFTLNQTHDLSDINCNFTSGGDGGGFIGHAHTTESKQKMSKKRIGKLHPMFGKKRKHSEESKKKMGRSGKLNHNYGKSLSKETKKKLSDSNRGKTHKKESKEKTSITMKKWHQDNPEFKKYRSCIVSGEANPRSKLTFNQVEEIKEKYKPRVYSKPQLAKEYGVSLTTIVRIISGISWNKSNRFSTKIYEGIIVGHYEGRRGSKREGLWGGFEVMLSNGIVTRVGSGFTDKMKAEINLNPDSWIGRIVEMEGQPDPLTGDGLTKDGKVRFPVYVRERDSRDVDHQIIERFESFKKSDEL